MSILLFLIGVSLTLASVAFAAFRWSVRDGQLDDLVGPGTRILCDDDQNEFNDMLHGETTHE